MDAILEHKILIAAEEFKKTEAFNSSESRDNPYLALLHSLVQYARNEDAPVLSSVIDKIVSRENANELKQGAAEGIAVYALKKLVDNMFTEKIVDEAKSPDIAAKVISDRVFKMTDEKLKSNQTKHELEVEQQRDFQR